MEGPANDFTNPTVHTGILIETDQFHLSKIHFSIHENTIISGDMNDLAHQDPVLEALYPALQRQRIFLNHRRIDICTLMHMGTGFFDLVYVPSAFDTEVIRDHKR